MTATEAYDTLLALSRATQPYSSAEESLISSLYTEVTGKKVRDCNCRDKWRDAVIEALLYIKRNNGMKPKCEYRLRAGVVLHYGAEVYTNANLTNAVARKFLADFPNAIDRFEVVPQPKTTKKRKK